MSIALDRIELETSGFGRVMKCGCDTSRFESTPAKENKKVVEEEEEDDDDWRNSSSTTSSSSIGRNSDEVSGRSSDGGDCDENEVQSSYKGGGLDVMDSLEQVLPMRRGISSFYNGKSKSFTSLADACSTDAIKEIAKPENAYTRRRRNLLAINHVWDKNRNRRPISSSKSTLAFAVAMSSSESISSVSEESSSTSSPSPRLPPLHPQTRTYFNSNTPSSSPPPSTRRSLSSWRSYSLADIQEYSTHGTINS